MSLSPVQFRLVTLANIFGGTFLWEGSLSVYQVAPFPGEEGSTPVAIAFINAAFDYWLGRLLLRQQEGDRNSYAVHIVAFRSAKVAWINASFTE